MAAMDVARVSLDIKTIFRDKADASELALNLINHEGKGVAKLTLDTGMMQSLQKLSTGGVGAVGSSVTDVDWGGLPRRGEQVGSKV